MKKTVAAFLTFLKCCCIIYAHQEKSDAETRDETTSFSEKSEKVVYHYLRPEVPFNDVETAKFHEKNLMGKPYFYPAIRHHQHNPEYIHPLVDALILSTSLGLNPKISTANHPELLPINPYLVLFLSHYGRYLPYGIRTPKGLYGYAAANNYHNNQPFGAYKVYEEQ